MTNDNLAPKRMLKVTGAKKCPHCGSENVKYQGVGHEVGTSTSEGKLTGRPRHRFKCYNCGQEFHFQGKL